MVLVTLGTQKQSFKRLLDYIEESSLDDEIIVQAGHTKYESKKMKIFDFIDYETMDEYLKKADLIITHGGTGSVVTPLKLGKKIIGCARLSKFGEHVDDHQTELIGIFADEGYILEIKDGETLDYILKRLETFKPKEYKSNTHNFVNKLRIEINR